MKYFIGDLARLLNLSSEMIRYYEKMEMFKPDRQEGSNYRIYSSRDVLLLITAMQLQSFQFKIKDIRHIRTISENRYTKEFLTDIIAFRERLVKELEYRNWLLMRVNELIERNHTALLNEGNFWLKRRPGQYRYPFLYVEKSGDFKCLLPESITNTLLSEQILPFCDFIVEEKDQDELWSLMILKEYGDYLNLPIECREALPPFISANTIIKASDFSLKNCKTLKDYAAQRNYHPNGDVYGSICGGMSLEMSEYFLELQLPVEKA